MALHIIASGRPAVIHSWTHFRNLETGHPDFSVVSQECSEQPCSNTAQRDPQWSQRCSTLVQAQERPIPLLFFLYIKLNSTPRLATSPGSTLPDSDVTQELSIQLTAPKQWPRGTRRLRMKERSTLHYRGQLAFFFDGFFHQ